MLPYDNNSYESAHVEDCKKNECSKLVYQYADISLPMELKPDVKVGKIEMECCGEPDITCKKTDPKDKCEFVITQKICLKIPVCYKVETCVGKKSVCCNCDKPCCEK